MKIRFHQVQKVKCWLLCHCEKWVSVNKCCVSEFCSAVLQTRLLLCFFNFNFNFYFVLYCQCSVLQSVNAACDLVSLTPVWSVCVCVCPVGSVYPLSFGVPHNARSHVSAVCADSKPRLSRLGGRAWGPTPAEKHLRWGEVLECRQQVSHLKLLFTFGISLTLRPVNHLAVYFPPVSHLRFCFHVSVQRCYMLSGRREMHRAGVTTWSQVLFFCLIFLVWCKKYQKMYFKIFG